MCVTISISLKFEQCRCHSLYLFLRRRRGLKLSVTLEPSSPGFCVQAPAYSDGHLDVHAKVERLGSPAVRPASPGPFGRAPHGAPLFQVDPCPPRAGKLPCPARHCIGSTCAARLRLGRVDHHRTTNSRVNHPLPCTAPLLSYICEAREPCGYPSTSHRCRARRETSEPALPRTRSFVRS